MTDRDELEEAPPTTQEIRQQWSRVRNSDFDPEAQWIKGQREDAFDRWLAAHDAQARAEVIDWIEDLKASTSPVSTATVVAAAREHFAPKPEGTDR